MARHIDYYFSLVSPWAFIGQQTFNNIVAKHGCSVAYRPVSLAEVFPQSGGLPLAKRHESRQKYRMMELRRWREKRQLSFHLKPRHWPFNPTLADCAAIAIAQSGLDPAPYALAAFNAIFGDQADLSNAQGIADLINRLGLSGDALTQQAAGDKAKAAYDENGKQALRAGVFGSPAYVLDGEIFWGQDRLDLLDDALSTGREPFIAD